MKPRNYNENILSNYFSLKDKFIYLNLRIQVRMQVNCVKEFLFACVCVIPKSATDH